MLLPIIFAIVAFFLVSHDQFLYEAPVGKITVAKTVSSHEVSDDFQNKDRQVTQELSIKVLNTKGAEPGNLNLKNTTTLSQTTGQIYRVGQQVIGKLSNCDLKKGCTNCWTTRFIYWFCH